MPALASARYCSTGLPVDKAQTDLRRRILHAFVGRGLIEKDDAKEILAYRGFAGDAGVCIEAHDRAALERFALLRPTAMDWLSKAGSALVYHCAKPHSEAIAGGKVAKLVLTPLELINRIAALVSPTRSHRHRYFGVLAPNSPLRAEVTAMALAQPVTTQAEPDSTSKGAPGVAPQSHAVQVQPEPDDPVPPKRSLAHYLWAVLIAHIYEVFPLLHPMCGGQMRHIAFITDGAEVRKKVPPDWDLAAQAVPDYETDKRVNR